MFIDMTVIVQMCDAFVSLAVTIYVETTSLLCSLLSPRIPFPINRRERSLACSPVSTCPEFYLSKKKLTSSNHIERLDRDVQRLGKHIQDRISHVLCLQSSVPCQPSRLPQTCAPETTYSNPSKNSSCSLSSYPTLCSWKFVSTIPGLTTSTLISVPTSSFLSALLNPSIAALFA